MKKLRLLILGLLAATAAICQAQTTDPGWYRATNQMTAPQSRSDFGSNQSQIQASDQFSPMNQQNVPPAPIAEAITPQIQALADGLQDDPVRIFDYVHDHIKFVLYFGSKKGANLTLLEKSGNDFDQCALLVALLSAAGYSNNVAYQFGWQEIPYDDPYGYDYDLHHWWQLTLNNTNWTTTYNYLFDLVYDRGYPQAYYFDDGNTFEVQRTWVALTIGSTTYQLDPAFKISEPVSGISLAGAMSSASISNDLMTAAAGTANGNYAQSLNEAAVRNKLTGYTTNLLNYIQSNAPNTSVQQILGGWQITPAYNPWDFSTDTWFYVDDFGGQMPVLGWIYEPTNLMSSLSIQFSVWNQQFWIPQLQGQRLTLSFYTNSGMHDVVFTLDDAQILSGAVVSGYNFTNVVLSVTHPVGSWDTVHNVFVPDPSSQVNQCVTNVYQEDAPQNTPNTYVILYAFEPDWGWLQQRQNKLDAYLAQGFTNGSPQVLAETLNIMGLNWMLQTAQTERMLAAQLGILPMYYHRLGRMAQETGRGYYVDVYMQFSGEYPAGGDDAAHTQMSNVHFDLDSFFGSALEHGMIEQLQNANIVGASTVKMLQIANANGQAVYLVSSTNWTAGYNVQSHLTNYDSGTLNTIYNKFISQGFYVLLPQNGSNHVSSAAGSWAGYGYEARQVVNGQATESAMIIAGGYHGGYSSGQNDTVSPPVVHATGDSQQNSFTAAPAGTILTTTGDPVDTVDDTFQVEHTDLSLGQGEPRGITLSRYYNGTRRNSNPAGMAGGWINNYCVTANNVAAPQACLGGTTPAQAASMFTATAAAIAMYNGGYPDPKNWLTTALIAKWGIDQLTTNGVTVNLGKDTLQFVQQPNGVFIPPANCTATLTQNGSAYSLLQRHGNTFNFDSLGRLASIMDQYNNSLTVSYLNSTSSLPQTVTDSKGRYFTFLYTGTPLILHSVSDGTHRTVRYGYSTNYNSQGDLTSFTDPDGNTTTYVYDTNHRITATLDAQSRLVVSNLYDSQGHVATQYTQGDTNKTWRIYWSGWQTTEFDPAGGEQDYLYDDFGRLIGQRDALGNLTQTFYDGQNHIFQTVSPLNETNQFIYDGNNNLIQTIDPLGFTNQFVYNIPNNVIRTIDPLGNVSTFGYNHQFSLTGATNGAGDFVNYSYNSGNPNVAGTLASRTDSGGTTTYGYDNTYGQLTNITYPNSLGSEGFVNNSFGDVTRHTDANGNLTTFSYNNRRQMTNSIAPTNLVAKISFDAVGNTSGTTDPRGNVSSYSWSATRHLLATTLPSTPQGVPVITNIYDSRDWLAQTINPQQSTFNYTNDAAGRLVSLTDPLSRTTTFGYDADGRRLTTTNAAQEVARQTWDARGELIQLTDGAGHISSRTYDSAGNQIILTNRNTNTWIFQFDGANRLTNTITPLGRSTSLAFNHQGLPATVTDPANQTTTNTYDGRARLITRGDKVGSTSYKYDGNNNLTNVTETINSQPSTNNFTFDAYNRMSSFKDVYGNLIQYRYDANGNMTNLIYPGGKNVYYAFDSLNHMTNVTDWAGRKTSIGYDLAGRMTSLTRPNGTFRTISYDVAGQATNIWEQMGNTLPIAWFRFNWANSGNMGWEFAAPLPHSNSVPTRTMTYDDDNRLATVDSYNVTVDLDGNLTSGPLTNDTFATYAFDARNRLLNVGGVTNAYDAMNNRIGQTCGTNSTAFVINPNAKLPQVLMRIKNGVTNYYIYGVGLLYQVTETATATNSCTYHFDYRGSTVALTDGNGLVTDRIEYSAYGLVTYRSGSTDTPFLFNGRYGVQSDGNGLLYMRARYYSPYLCRFISADPSGFAGGLNHYAAFSGNPVSYRDPSGLSAVATGDTSFTWVPGASATPADLSNPFGVGTGYSSLNYETIATALSVGDIAQFGAEYGSGTAVLGLYTSAAKSSGFYFKSSFWGGSQYVTTMKISTIAGRIAWPLAAASTYNDYKHFGMYSSQFWAGGSATVIGLAGGPPGAAAALVYGIGHEAINYDVENTFQLFTDMYYGAPYGPAPEQ